MDKLERLYKYANGGTVRKMQHGGKFNSYGYDQQQDLMNWANKLGIYSGGEGLTDELVQQVLSNPRFQAWRPNFDIKNTELQQNTNIASFAAKHHLSASDAEHILDEEGSMLSADNAMFERAKSSKHESIDGLSGFRNQGTVSFNPSNLSLNKNGSISGGQITLTNSDGTTLTRQVGPSADKIPSEGLREFGAGMGTAAAEISKAAVGLVGAYGGQGGINGAQAFSTGVDAAMQGDAKTAAAGIVGGAATAAVNAVDKALMGDKNFSASSQAIDTAVHGVSGALMKSGNPFTIGAGALLEGLNFVTKAGGKNVQGYDVNIESSGYGNLGHMESEAGRIWDNWSGATDRKLAKRNEQARMALAAADISESQAFEQEARANSITNVLQQNLIALAGGIDTSLLAS